MKRKRYTEAQILGFLKEADAGIPVKELCRKHGFSDASFYNWRSKYGGMELSDIRRLKVLEQENARLKKLLAETLLDKEAIEVALRKKYRPRRQSGQPSPRCSLRRRSLNGAPVCWWGWPGARCVMNHNDQKMMNACRQGSLNWPKNGAALAIDGSMRC